GLLRRGPAGEEGLDRLQPTRPVGDAADPESHGTDHTAVDLQRRQRHGESEVALAAGELGEPGAPAGGKRRQLDARKNFVRRKRGGEGPTKEIGGGYGSRTGDARQMHGRAEGRGDQAPLRGWIGVREAAAEG